MSIGALIPEDFVLGSFVHCMFSKKVTKIDEIFIVDLTVTTYCQIDSEDFVNFCGLLRKRKLYKNSFRMGTFGI